MRAGIVALGLVMASPAFGESSLGITGATLSFGGLEDEMGSLQTIGRGTVDVAVTDVHGLQGDLSVEDTAQGTIGRLAGHLYMDPVPGQKYGLFLAVSDLDGRSLSWTDFGAEGQLNLGSSTLVSGRAGIGQTDHGNPDYVFGGISLVFAPSSAIELELALDVSDFDETDFRATAIDTGVTATFAPQGQPWGVYAQAVHSNLRGRDGAGGETRFGLGLSFSFGSTGGTSANTRHFRDHDAVAPLVRRGIF